MRSLDDMVIIAKRVDVLTALRANREKHAKVVIEARAGYLRRAEAALMARLDQLKSGKYISMGFRLQMPQDHTAVYDTAITMMEMHTGDEVKLNSEQVRNLIRDEWEWTASFYHSNAAYSSTAAEARDSLEPGGEP